MGTALEDARAYLEIPEKHTRDSLKERPRGTPEC